MQRLRGLQCCVDKDLNQQNNFVNKNYLLSDCKDGTENINHCINRLKIVNFGFFGQKYTTNSPYNLQTIKLKVNKSANSFILGMNVLCYKDIMPN